MEEATNDPGSEEALPGRLRDCSPGTADCDRDPKNGCEAVLAADTDNCGICGVTCAAANAEPSCLGGTCRVISCKSGFCDTDGDPDNGCETAAKTCHH